MLSSPTLLPRDLGSAIQSPGREKTKVHERPADEQEVIAILTALMEGRTSELSSNLPPAHLVRLIVRILYLEKIPQNSITKLLDIFTLHLFLKTVDPSATNIEIPSSVPSLGDILPVILDIQSEDISNRFDLAPDAETISLAVIEDDEEDDDELSVINPYYNEEIAERTSQATNNAKIARRTASLAYTIRELHLLIRKGVRNEHIVHLYHNLTKVYQASRERFFFNLQGRLTIDYIDLLVFDLTRYDPFNNDSSIQDGDWQSVKQLSDFIIREIIGLDLSLITFDPQTADFAQFERMLNPVAQAITNYAYLAWQYQLATGENIVNEDILRVIKVRIKDALQLAYRFGFNNPKFYRNILEMFDNLIEMGFSEPQIQPHLAALAWNKLRTVDADYLSRFKSSTFWDSVAYMTRMGYMPVEVKLEEEVVVQANEA